MQINEQQIDRYVDEMETVAAGFTGSQVFVSISNMFAMNNCATCDLRFDMFPLE